MQHAIFILFHFPDYKNTGEVNMMIKLSLFEQNFQFINEFYSLFIIMCHRILLNVSICVIDHSNDNVHEHQEKEKRSNEKYRKCSYHNWQTSLIIV